jgi:hypothetical protein
VRDQRHAAAVDEPEQDVHRQVARLLPKPGGNLPAQALEILGGELSEAPGARLSHRFKISCGARDVSELADALVAEGKRLGALPYV